MKTLLRLGRATAALIALVLGHGTALASPVQVESGALQGVEIKGLSIYRGVPYALAPLGDLRWREPQPVKPWRGYARQWNLHLRVCK